MRRLDFTIESNWLYVGDDAIRLDLIKKLRVENSCLDNTKYAIHLHTDNMVLELYYTSPDKTLIQDACDELLLAIIEAKKENENTIG
ncbi:MAG: hypothetical protein ACLRFL_02415 [Clostridia bacterium]